MFRIMTPAVRALLVANVLVALAQLLLGAQAMAPLELWPIVHDPYLPYPDFRPWQLVSYAFLHAGFWHIFMNMLVLVMFGPEVERLLGTRRFQFYYFTCVVGAGLAQLAVGLLSPASAAPTVGASGGIFGVLLCFAMHWPRQQILVYFVPVPAWLFVSGYAALELYQGVFGRNEGVAHFAHLGGMAAGYLLLRIWRATDRRRRA
jgi:membrane associated rhomboid family serine protease